MGFDPEWGFLPVYNTGMFKPYNPEQTSLAADVISAHGLPDILCLCEVESLLALRLFNAIFLGNHYTYAVLIDSYDFRQIDVGVLSTREILSVRTHVDDVDAFGRRIFSRDCLEVTVGLNKSGTRKLHIFVNHFKSKFSRTDNPAETERSNLRRLVQAESVNQILKKRFPASRYGTSKFVVLGDFNDQPGSDWVKPLVKDAQLYNAIESLPREEQWTYWYKARNQASQLDYILLSPALTNLVQQHNQQPVIERRGIGFKGFYASGNRNPLTTRIFWKEDDTNPLRINFDFPRYTEVDQTGQHASDHCPIILDLPV
jgi:endonuclease/exonuclease/phosphatase family metal-dependent hydrolase